MSEKQAPAPDSTAVRVALWRAMHVQLDAPPHVFDDVLGLALAAPTEDWKQRPDMHPERTKLFRASIVGRARFVEDHVAERVSQGVSQYVILGAGLDTFVQRRPEFSSRLKVFEVDQPGPQAWKRRRLEELGFGVPDWLRLVPVDFEAGDSWLAQLTAAGFDPARPAIIASTGVSMYLTKEATATTLRHAASLAGGCSLIMSFIVPFDMADPEIRQGLAQSAKGAQASRTPFISFYTPDEIQAMAREAGFTDVRHVPSGELNRLYFAHRTDGLHLPSAAEDLLVASFNPAITA